MISFQKYLKEAKLSREDIKRFHSYILRDFGTEETKQLIQLGFDISDEEAKDHPYRMNFTNQHITLLFDFSVAGGTRLQNIQATNNITGEQWTWGRVKDSWGNNLNQADFLKRTSVELSEISFSEGKYRQSEKI